MKFLTVFATLALAKLFGKPALRIDSLRQAKILGGRSQTTENQVWYFEISFKDLFEKTVLKQPYEDAIRAIEGGALITDESAKTLINAIEEAYPKDHEADKPLKQQWKNFVNHVKVAAEKFDTNVMMPLLSEIDRVQNEVIAHHPVLRKEFEAVVKARNEFQEAVSELEKGQKSDELDENVRETGNALIAAANNYNKKVKEYRKPSQLLLLGSIVTLGVGYGVVKATNDQ